MPIEWALTITAIAFIIGVLTGIGWRLQFEGAENDTR